MSTAWDLRHWSLWWLSHKRFEEYSHAIHFEFESFFIFFIDLKSSRSFHSSCTTRSVIDKNSHKTFRVEKCLSFSTNHQWTRQHEAFKSSNSNCVECISCSSFCVDKHKVSRRSSERLLQHAKTIIQSLYRYY